MGLLEVSKLKLELQRIHSLRNRVTYLHHARLLFIGEIMWRHHADAERAAQFIAQQTGHSERALHVGCASACFGHAPEIGLEIAQFDWLHSFRCRAGDTFAHRNFFNDGHQMRRDAALRDEREQLRLRVESVQRASGAVEVGDHDIEDCLPVEWSDGEELGNLWVHRKNRE